MIFRFNISVFLDSLSDDEFVYTFLNMFNKDINLSSVCPYQRVIYEQLNPIMVSMLQRRSNAFQERKRRIQNRIDFMLANGDCIFVTLTLADDSYSFRYVRGRVTEFLRKFDFYVANADWGKLNGRLHYHAVIMTEHINHNDWPLGLINFKRIYVSEKSSKKLAKYVAKLTNHAVKESVKGSKCIYSKNFFKLGL